MRILLAEDDADIANFIARGLGDLGHVVVCVGNGAEALEKAATESFDAIVLDRMLPRLEGLEVLRRLRQREVTTPVLVLTAKGGVADRVDGLNAGADDYLVKPFEMTELVARLNALVRRSPANAAMTQLEVGDIKLDKLRRDVVTSCARAGPCICSRANSHCWRC